MSVKIIKIGNTSQEENDSNNLRVLSEKSFAECERTYIDVINYDSYKKKGQTTTLLA